MTVICSLRSTLWAACLAAQITACESQTEKQLKGLNITEEQARQILLDISGQPERAPVPAEHRLPGAPLGERAAEKAAVPEVAEGLDPLLLSDDWVVDGLFDVAPAAPSIAIESGIVVINGENKLLLAKLSGLAEGREPAASRLDTISDTQGPFALGRGPTVADGYAYWVTNRFLLRRPTRPPFSPLDILAEDARVGTRTSILPRDKKRNRDETWVAYVALPTEKGGPLRAKMWHGETSQLLLTPAGNSSLSVGLFDTGQRVFALSVEARTGATAIHARELLAKPKPWALSDEVVWVGGGAQPMTELHLVKSIHQLSPELIGLMPLEQDVTHFGLVALHFPDITRRVEPSVDWTIYKNGLDPAPIASATLCGQVVALFARPSNSQPGSPQELVLARLNAGKPDPGVILARSKAFYDISLAGLDRLGTRSAGRGERGALLSYVADRRTWGRTVRCLNKP